MTAPLPMSVTCNRSYLPHVATMLRSAQSVSDQPPLTVHLLHDGGIGPDDLAPLHRMLDARGDVLDAIAVEPDRVGRLSSEHFSVTAWFRVLLPDLLPAVARVLHIDGDALVCRSLAGLADVDLRGRPFAAVQNPLYPWMEPAWSRLGLPEGTRYLNSGVMVLDLDRLRGLDASSRLLEYGAAHPENRWPEQDALTAVFPDDWHELPPVWNVQTTVLDLSKRHLPFARRDIVDARRDPGIVHFSGPFKPWNGWGATRWIRAYHDHRSQTGYPTGPMPRRRPASLLAPLLPIPARRRFLRRTVRRDAERHRDQDHDPR